MLAIKWDNGMVMVFDQDTGKQVTEMQGRYEEVREKCREQCDKFQHGEWFSRILTDVSREEW